jgi:His/Glu/Gln/Arg/opine family amino acid ABC transporter permease subunit
MEVLKGYLNHMIAVLPVLLKGAVYTVEITVTSVFFGVIIGLVMSLGKMSKNPVLRIPSIMYIDFIRGTPLMVQILLFYYGVSGLLAQITGGPVRFEPLLSGVVVCSLNSGAYVAEIFRAGIQSIDKGQMEAARSLGMTHGMAMRYVILPQAFRRIIPPLGNEFITLLKDSSLLSVIGVMELLQSGRLYVAKTYASFPVYITVSLVYLAMTVSITRLVAWGERRLGISDRSEGAL